MYEMMDAHPLTVIVVVGSIMVTPFYIFAAYVFSGASARKGAWIGSAFLLFGAVMFYIGIADIPRSLGLLGNAIVPLLWALPVLILFIWRDWFLSDPLSQKWLIGLQLFRAIGAVFLIEMLRGNLPGIFAWPAGVGDVLVALIALAVLLTARGGKRIGGGAVVLVAAVGVADFLGAFFFGFTSSASPLQLFHPEVPNNVIVFPTGMIPLFLVPYAIFFHGLSVLNYYRFERGRRRPSVSTDEVTAAAERSIASTGTPAGAVAVYDRIDDAGRSGGPADSAQYPVR